MTFRVPTCDARHGEEEKALGSRPGVSHFAFLRLSLLIQIKVCSGSQILCVTIKFNM